MFLNSAYLLPDYVTHTSLPKLFIRIRSVAIKFKGRPEPLYFTPDESRVFDVRGKVQMGGTIGCVIRLPQGEAEMNFCISAGWQQGLFQLWDHGYAGGFIPKAENDVFEVEGWELYEYSLYAAPTCGRQFPDLTDRPIDNYKTHEGIVVRDNNKYGLEILERLKAQATRAPVAAVEIHQIGNDEPVTIAILKAGSEMLGCLTFRDNADVDAICHDLCQLVPANNWLGCEDEMYEIAVHLVAYRQMPTSIPRIFKTKRFSCDSSYCTLDRSLLDVENGQPVFKLFTEQRNDLKPL